ncbi:hypothetical protein M569_17558 [Genlisea aurea]|uniref:Uncharacterized protein n=1 Tax=Genlisea aurea TaxID=192259 RepID=S8DD52_9LAMI|nr:hypothetical protein M569_17558 [Genlisea aurea]
MSPYAVSQNSFAAREELGSVSSRSEKMVVCPKPRRLGMLQPTLNDPPIRTLRWHSSFDNNAGNDLFDIILLKVRGGCESDHQISSSPPFFSGSPPSRVSNPLIQDSRFGAISPRSILTRSAASPPPPPPSASRKFVCARSTFGDNPAVRIEGFDCLDMDRRKISIPTLA